MTQSSSQRQRPHWLRITETTTSGAVKYEEEVLGPEEHRTSGQKDTLSEQFRTFMYDLGMMVDCADLRLRFDDGMATLSASEEDVRVIRDALLEAHWSSVRKLIEFMTAPGGDKVRSWSFVRDGQERLKACKCRWPRLRPLRDDISHRVSHLLDFRQTRKRLGWKGSEEPLRFLVECLEDFLSELRPEWLKPEQKERWRQRLARYKASI